MKFLRQHWYLALFSLLYGAFMLALDGEPGMGIHSASPYHRLQAEALLQGHFYLSDSIESIQPGLAWHDGKVQQVWGLGIALWLLPFEAATRLFGGSAFPERIALGIGFALLAFFTGRTGMRLVHEGRRGLGLGLLWLVLLCPSLWTLARNSGLIFEETVLYALILSLGILISIVRVVLFGSRGDFWLCCILGAFAVWVRPTHAVYGIAAGAIAATLQWRRERKWALPVGALLLVGFSGLLLMWTNIVRFGSPTEFGHRITVSTGSMVYLTRFGNPFKAPVVDAIRELVGVLFLNSNVRGAGAFSEDLFPGQAPFPRWRRLDLSTFDVSWGILLAVAVVAGVVWLSRKRHEKSTEVDLISALLLWAGLSLVGLTVFYLYYPAIASRYLLDFAPAFIGFVLIPVFIGSKRWSKSVLTMLTIWLAVEIVGAKTPVPEIHNENLLKSDTPGEQSSKGIVNFNGIYTTDEHPSKTRIPCNGSGWEPDSGFAANVVTVMVDKPEFLELVVCERRMRNGEAARKDVYRAQIDGHWMRLEKVEPSEGNLIVLFTLPPLGREKRQNEAVFVCFSKDFDEEDRNSERIIESIRWRNAIARRQE